jgi:hypothetical protein
MHLCSKLLLALVDTKTKEEKEKIMRSMIGLGGVKISLI